LVTTYCNIDKKRNYAPARRKVHQVVLYKAVVIE
jgi:hypothetical protein